MKHVLLISAFTLLFVINASAQLKVYQNTPNPFDANTLMKYRVPSDTKDAYIFIFDMRGTMASLGCGLSGSSCFG